MVADGRFGRKMISICENLPSRSSGWHGALPIKKIILRFCLLKRPLSLPGISSRMSVSSRL